MKMLVLVLCVLVGSCTATPSQSQAMYTPQAAMEMLTQLQTLIAQHVDTHPELKALQSSAHLQQAAALIQQLATHPMPPASHSDVLTAAPPSVPVPPTLMAQHGSRPAFALVPSGEVGDGGSGEHGRLSWLKCDKTDWGPALAVVMMRLGGENWTSTLPVLMFYLHAAMYYVGCLLFGN